MDLLKGILQEKGTELLGALTGKAGFSMDQAERFLPAAGSAVTDTLKDQAANLDVANLASEGNVQAVLGGIDTQALAAKAGVSAQQGAAGLKAIVPTLLGLLSSKAGGAEGLLGMLRGLGDDTGGMLGKLGKKGKGLFGN